MHTRADFGTGDFRYPSYELEYEVDGSRIAPLEYLGHEVLAGKPVLDATQPAYYVEADDEATTLRVDLTDPLTELRMELWYTVFHDYDVITRRVVVINSSPSAVQLRSLMSATVDFSTPKTRYTMSHLSGAWARERHLVTDRLLLGTKSVESRRGVSSHQHNPFVIISDGCVASGVVASCVLPSLVGANAQLTDRCRQHAVWPGGAGGGGGRPHPRPYSEHVGEHFAFSLVYAGDFLAHAEIGQTSTLRLSMGINPMTFEWNLAPGAAFVAPEIALAYSNDGVGELSRQLHRLMRTRLVRGAFRDRPRPTLVNRYKHTRARLQDRPARRRCC